MQSKHQLGLNEITIYEPTLHIRETDSKIHNEASKHDERIDVRSHVATPLSRSTNLAYDDDDFYNDALYLDLPGDNKTALLPVSHPKMTSQDPGKITFPVIQRETSVHKRTMSSKSIYDMTSKELALGLKTKTRTHENDKSIKQLSPNGSYVSFQINLNELSDAKINNITFWLEQLIEIGDKDNSDPATSISMTPGSEDIVMLSKNAASGEVMRPNIASNQEIEITVRNASIPTFMQSTKNKRNAITQPSKTDTKGDRKPPTKSIEDEAQTFDEKDTKGGNLYMERVQIASNNSYVTQIESKPKLKLKLAKVENSLPVVDEIKMLPMKFRTSEFNKPHYSKYFGNETTILKSNMLANGSVRTTKVTGKLLSSHDITTNPTDFEKNTKPVTVEMTASLPVLKTGKSSPSRAHRHKLKGSYLFNHIKDNKDSTVNVHE